MDRTRLMIGLRVLALALALGALLAPVANAQSASSTLSGSRTAISSASALRRAAILLRFTV